ncbi:MAG: hypothetical protein AMXMBFR66_08830 [Pseudomonadota bacterium]|nr:PaaI family thioesterase [Rubrivivax sp.]NLZ40003.1 PaaI family thioesterase [Comamonadaceae bacterium]
MTAAAIPPGFAPVRFGGAFIEGVGPLYVRHEDGLFRLGLRVEPRHCNPRGVCHGGMLATFCDMLLPIGTHYLSAEAGRRFLPTVSLQLDYLAPVALGAWLEGRCEVLRVARSMVFAQGLVLADGVAAVRCSGTFKIGPPFGDDARSP